MRLRTLPIPATALLWFACAPVLAQGGVRSPAETVRDLVEQLDRPAWLERDLATIELGQLHPDIGLADLEVFISDPDLSFEQRARLMDAALDRYLAHPKGALGVQFGTIRVGAIEVQPIGEDPRFPATALLNPGDAIAMVDGKIVDGSFDLRAQIVSREPGQVMATTIIRNQRLLDVELELGSFDTLTGAARMDLALARAALALRWQRRGIQTPPDQIVGERITLEDWIAAAFPEGAEPDASSPDRRLQMGVIADNALAYEPNHAGRTRGVDPWRSPDALRRSAVAGTLEEIREDLRELEAEQRLLQRRADDTGDPDDPRLAEVAERVGALRARASELGAILEEETVGDGD